MSAYILPDRKTFVDSITRIFKIERSKDITPADTEDADVDLCIGRSGPGRELLPYQKLIREYLLIETPYRGLLVYHGLGSGKTCSAIAVAESLISTHKIYVVLPAGLRENFKVELKKCGDTIYQENQHWEVRVIKEADDKVHGKSLGISEAFMDTNGKYFVTIPNLPSNWKDLDTKTRKQISEQISDTIDKRFHFINYNGINKSNFDTIFPPDQPNMFDDSVIIIDEAHNFIGNVLNESELKMKMYDMMYHAKNTKVVLLSGTPIINRPQEIALLMNLIRGPIERVIIPTSQVISWDEGMMTTFFRSLPDVDTIEYNSVKRLIMLTRNPAYFETVYNEKNERTAVKYNKDLDFEADILKWVTTWGKKFETQFNGTELAIDKCVKEELECLPSKFEEFVNTFVDGLKIKNALLFQRRIQGLVSYFKGSDERLLAKRIDQENELVKVPVSSPQFLRYLDVRNKEMQIDKNRGRMKNDLNEDLGSYRTNSRTTCNFAIPPEFLSIAGDDKERKIDSEAKEEILKRIKQDPKSFLNDKILESYSPKMLQILRNIQKNVGTFPNLNSQFVYSNFTTLEGSGLFGAILEYNGFQEYKLVKVQGVYREDPSLKPNVPCFAFYTGDNEDQRELLRQIFNDNYEDGFPQSLKDSIQDHKLCVLLGSRSAAEGINLMNVRNVHIMESHWNPSLLDQVVGRAIRICSHKSLPIPDRTVKVNIYISVFTDEQFKDIEGPNIVMIRRNDMILKRYDVEQPIETFMTTDEYLYEISYEKGRIAKSIITLLKQAAIDCEIHRKLHAKNGEIIQCMRYDTTAKGEDLGYKPNYVNDERDAFYLRNVKRVKRHLQRVVVKGIEMIIDPDTNEVFDAPAFEDNQRLLRIGMRKSPTEIVWFTI
jgi:hypothetical protein